jgi:hypothetical protein
MNIDVIDRIAGKMEDWTRMLHKNLLAPIQADDPLEQLILNLHRKNFQLWNTEDIARRRDVEDAVIVDAKRTIDLYNQERNDTIEKIDGWLLETLYHELAHTILPVRTETPGSALDRLSVLCLKIHHMEIQTQRTDADQKHRDTCTEKLKIMNLQRTNLVQSIKTYFDDLNHGLIRMVVYRQYKMYNDPALNPQLYGVKK